MSTHPTFDYEDKYEGLVCGLDEVGRGPLAGPVVAACVVIDRAKAPTDVLAQINDSKKLSASKREHLFNKIREFSYISLSTIDIKTIDTINILQASLKAMQEAYTSLCKQTKLIIPSALVDGNKAPKIPCHVETIVKGDSKSLSIAAASIIAKHHRDELMKEYAREYPHYGWEKNAGYGTASHLKALEKYGVTPLHRRSFAPIAEALKKAGGAIR